MEGDEWFLKDRRDVPAANSLECRSVEFHQVLTFKADKAFVNFPICRKDSQKSRRERALAGSRFTQHAQRFTAPHNEADARECHDALAESCPVGHTKIHNLKKGFMRRQSPFVVSC